MDPPLSTQDHTILSRIAEARLRKAKKDRVFCRAIGIDWLAFCADKPRGDSRIKLGAKQYHLDPDSLRRHARLAQIWGDLADADAWAAQNDFVNPYEFEPQASLSLLDAFRASSSLDDSDDDTIRLDQTDSSVSKIDIRCGKALAVLKTLPDHHFHCGITSPPYWRVRDWGAGAIGMEPTLNEYLAAVVAVFRELRRVMRPGAVTWVVIGDRYASRSRPEASNHGKFLYHPQPASPADDIPLGNRLLIPQRLTIALQDDGWIVRSVIAWDKIRQVSVGVKKRPISTHDEILMLTTHASNYYYQDPTGPLKLQRVGPFARILGRRNTIVDGKTHSADVLRISPDKHLGHTAPFPQELVRWCAVRTCPGGGHILDPFAGGGTTGLVAKEMALNATLIEINPKFVALARRRINAVARNCVAPDLLAAD